MKKRSIGIIGLACITAGIGLTGCAGSNEQPTEATTLAETTTVAETTTTTAETTTTTQETTSTAEETTTTTEAPTTTAKAHPEDDQIMEYLRSYYKSHDTSSGVPRGDDYGHYVRYAIADFNADGKNELAVEYKTDNADSIINIFIYPAEKIDFENFNTIDRSIGFRNLSEVAFLDNGVAYDSISQNEIDFYPDRDYLDKKLYFIMSNDVLQKLNYNLDNLRDYDGKLHQSFLLEYYKENGSIYKLLGSGQEQFFDPVVKTQEQYNDDKAILDSGNIMNIEVKDFTAENIGL